MLAGGAGYLGSTLARGMRESGMTVIILDVTASDRRLSKPVSGLIRFACDVTSKDDVIRSRDIIVQRYRRVDVLLNMAGANAPTPFFDISQQEFEGIIHVNLLGTLYGCQVFGEHMVQRRRGSIVNFSSVSCGPPLSKAFVYSTAKAGVFNLTQNLAREWAPFQVRVNALRPGFFPTEWSRKHFITPERQQAILNHTPMKRYGRPGELVGAVLWLSSDAASFVTGAEITVDGGFTCMTI